MKSYLRRFFTSQPNEWSVTLADGEYYDLPAGKIIWGFVIFGDQTVSGMFVVSSVGAVEILIANAGGANLVAADTPGKYCIFDNGTNARIRNRSGVGGIMTVTYFYAD